MEKFWGLVEYKPQWTLTLRGVIVVLLLAAAGVLLIMSQIHSFLAFSKPIKADALVVEGWIGDEALKGAIAEFAQGDYKLLITTGAPIGKGFYLTQYQNTAELSSAILGDFGFDSTKLVTLPSSNVKRNRTAAAAFTVYEWLANTDLSVRSINLYSSNLHTRRSWLIFKQVLEPKIEVGVICAPSFDYEPKHWWTTSAGVRSVISETIAYLYSRLISWSS